MAKLPSSVNLSGPGSFRSGRVIASQDTSAIGRGLASLGNDLSAIGAEKTRKENALDLTMAESVKVKGILDAKNEFQNDPEYATFDKRVPARTNEVINRAASVIRDPKARELWLAGAAGDAARANDAIFGYGDARRKATEINAFDDALEVNRRVYVDPNTSEEEKQRARADIEASIDMAVETGFLDPNQADTRKTNYLENADFSRAKLAVDQNPNVFTSRGDLVSAGDVPNGTVVANAGKGFTTLKLPNGEVVKRTGTRAWRNNNPGNIEFGKFARTHGAIGTDGRFAVFPSYAAGRAAKYDLLFNTTGYKNKTIEGAINRYAPPSENNTKSYYDQVAAGIGVSPSTPLSSLSETQRQTMLDAMEIVEGFRKGKITVPEYYKNLSPEQRAVVDSQAETERNKQNATIRGQIDVAAQNAPFAIQNTGEYTGYVPSPEDFFQAYGPQDGAAKYNAFQTAMQTSEQVFEMRTMSAADIRTMVEEATPASSGENAKLETDRYNTLSSAAETTLKARESDPASYVQRSFPSVEQAWNDVNDAGGYQAAISASVAAQQQLGIQNIAPLPKPVANGVVNTFKDKEQAEADRIAAVSGVLFATPDPEQRRAIFDQLVDAGLPPMTEGAFEAMARGESGAARRLMQAAMVDVSALPGQSPEKQSSIDEAIQSQLMDTKKIGDIYYGLSNGSAENYARAENDAKLISNAVHLRLRQGEGLSEAIDATAKDLYGDVQVLGDTWGVNIQAIIPTDANAGAVKSGFAALLPQVREAMTTIPAIAGDASTADGSKAVIDAVTANYADNVIATGFFRNRGEGFVFIDPYVGGAVEGPDGEPLMFSMEDVIAAGADKPRATKPESPRDTRKPEERGIGMLPPQIMQDQQSEYPKWVDGRLDVGPGPDPEGRLLKEYHNRRDEFKALGEEALSLKDDDPRLAEISDRLDTLDMEISNIRTDGNIITRSPELNAKIRAYREKMTR